MGNVLAFCETAGGALRTSAKSCVAFARQAAEQHGGEVVILLVGKGARSAAAEAATFAPRVLVVDDPRLEAYQAETYAPIVARAAQAEKAGVVAAIASALGKDLMARVAGLLGAGMASDVAAISDKNRFRRAILAGNAFSVVQVDSDPIVVTARQSEFEAAQPLGSAGQVAAVEAGEVNALGAEIVRVESSKSDRPDLNDADIVVSGGRGMKNGENFKVLEQLADLLGAAMGASRAATDAGFVPADWQVGQTGKVVAPNLYFAVAISGAIQHLAGMKGSKTIVAINKDGEAPIFQVADYGLVATWEQAIPELVAEIKKLKASQT
ncbi:MAG TPA: FAD-binding protein [Kofleriaceae bacterium]|nr:FAD-binding protein [Kofleriaceae bacterium]